MYTFRTGLGLTIVIATWWKDTSASQLEFCYHVTRFTLQNARIHVRLVSRYEIFVINKVYVRHGPRLFIMTCPRF